jgi:hypothetical protein
VRVCVYNGFHLFIVAMHGLRSWEVVCQAVWQFDVLSILYTLGVFYEGLAWELFLGHRQYSFDQRRPSPTSSSSLFSRFLA